MGIIPTIFIVEGEGPSRGARNVSREEEEERQSLLREEDLDEDVAVIDSVDEESESGSESERRRETRKRKGYGTLGGEGEVNGESK